MLSTNKLERLTLACFFVIFSQVLNSQVRKEPFLVEHLKMPYFKANVKLEWIFFNDERTSLFFLRISDEEKKILTFCPYRKFFLAPLEVLY